VDRNPEIRKALDEIYEYAFSNKPDCILICGDLFNHYVAPSENDAKEVLSRIIEFSKIAPVAIVLGNHDWRGLATYNPFSSRMGIYILSTLGEEPLEAIENLRLYYFPYFSLRNLLKKFQVSELQDRAREFLSIYKNKYKSFSRLDRWNILLGHFSVEGVSYQNEITFSSEFFVPKDFLSSELFDYAALGHIHSQRRIPGASVPSYYCGSLVRVGFGEENNTVGALWVELRDGEGVKVDPISVSSKPLKTFKLSVSEIVGLKDLLKSYEEDAYIRVIIDISGGTTFSPSYYINNVFSMDERIVKVVLERERAREEKKIATLRNKGLVEIFEEYLKMRGIQSPSLLEKFKNYYERVEREDEAS